MRKCYSQKVQGNRKISVRSSSFFIITGDRVFQNKKANGIRIKAPTIFEIKMWYNGADPKQEGKYHFCKMARE